MCQVYVPRYPPVVSLSSCAEQCVAYFVDPFTALSSGRLSPSGVHPRLSAAVRVASGGGCRALTCCQEVSPWSVLDYMEAIQLLSCVLLAYVRMSGLIIPTPLHNLHVPYVFAPADLRRPG